VRVEEYYQNKFGARNDKRFGQDHLGKQADETWSSRPFVPSHCQGVTKMGVACKARPVHGQMLCVGHLRQAEAAFNATE